MLRPPKKFIAHPFFYHQEIELLIDSLTNLGSGVGRYDGWVVFVPFVLPGETVIARIFRNDKNCSHADLVSIITPSPDRITPRCPLFGGCGGCQYQHLPYERQLEWKSRQVGELLRHMAATEFPVSPCHPSPQIWNYRSKITPHFEKQRDGTIGPIGFLANGLRHTIIDVPHCPIAIDAINDALPSVRKSIHNQAATIKRGATLLFRATAEGIAHDFRQIVREHVGDMVFEFLAGDFFQNNPFILADFTSHVRDEASSGGARFLVDAYCGSGLFALTLARSFEQIAGVEVSETAAALARRNAETNHITNANFLTASAESIFSQIDFPPEHTAVVIDPPRKGCTPEFLDQLISFSAGRVVYVSCDPATQIRDLKHLKAGGFELIRVQPFDLFPHTRHLECVMTLAKRSVA